MPRKRPLKTCKTSKDDLMNIQTLILTIFVLWLITGLAFLSSYSEVKRTGGALVDALRNNEAFFFMLSLAVGVVVIAFKIGGAF